MCLSKSGFKEAQRESLCPGWQLSCNFVFFQAQTGHALSFGEMACMYFCFNQNMVIY
jgi:hypothetical protein